MTRNVETVENDADRTATYHRHPNGSGLIGPGAQAEVDSFISATTYVEAGARIGSGCRIGRGGWIDHQAIVGDHGVVGVPGHQHAPDTRVGRGDGPAHLCTGAPLPRGVRFALWCGSVLFLPAAWRTPTPPLRCLRSGPASVQCRRIHVRR